MRLLIGFNEQGQRVGEFHPAAKLKDAEVELLLQLREEGFSYGWLAMKFEISKSQARNICKGRKRWQIPCAWRVIHVEQGAG